MVFNDYKIEAMKMLWNAPEGSKGYGSGYGSHDVWNHVNKEFSKRGSSISRASVINFLNGMVDEGFLDFYEMTGKGGHRRIYSAKLDEKEFWAKIIETTVEKLEEASGISILKLLD